MNKEFKNLIIENSKLRDVISKVLDLSVYSQTWKLINKLIENEIEQEGFCNN